MKKLAKMAAMLLAAAMSLSGVTAFAAEAPEHPNRNERPAFLENAKFPKGGMIRNGESGKKPELTEEQKAAMIEGVKASLAEKLAAGEITQEKYDEAIAKIEEGGFAFGGKGFKGMAGKKPENMGDFRMPAFSGKEFKGMNGKPGERPELTDEQKAAMLEKIKSALGDEFPAGRPMPPKGPGMMTGRAPKPATAEKQ